MDNLAKPGVPVVNDAMGDGNALVEIVAKVGGASVLGVIANAEKVAGFHPPRLAILTSKQAPTMRTATMRRGRRYFLIG